MRVGFIRVCEMFGLCGFRLFVVLFVKVKVGLLGFVFGYRYKGKRLYDNK